MQRKVLQLLIVGAALIAWLVSVGAASAATWNTNGPVNFTATAGTTQFRTSSGAALVCTGPNSATDTLAAGPFASGANLATVTQVFNACRVGGISFTMSCSAATFDGTTWAANGGTMGSQWSTSVTTGVIRGISCTLAITTCVVTVTGTVPATYTNPVTTTPTASGFFTLLVTGQNLRVATNGAVTCIAVRIGNGDTATFIDGSGGNAVYTVTVPAAPTAQPRIWMV